ncbi:hypothetical protein M0R45_030011 [Rubus argutus]|uniref:Uncharacterized protein n=1 Tax=Rubus argutus TaxID=59490 RepID=A0AAW1W9R4_RUBAR
MRTAGDATRKRGRGASRSTPVKGAVELGRSERRRICAAAREYGGRAEAVWLDCNGGTLGIAEMAGASWARRRAWIDAASSSSRLEL